MTPVVERMVQRYVETGVKAQHYPSVAKALFPAIRDVLGEARQTWCWLLGMRPIGS